MFIVFEGLDGCGKSTHAKLLSEWLMNQGQDTYLTAEPTNSRIGMLIREVLSGKIVFEPETLAYLFTADRVEHTGEISSAIEGGSHVVCERYVYSTAAYQGAQGLDSRWLMDLSSFAPKPDVIIFLDVEPKDAEERAFTGEIFEKASFLEKVKKEYMKFKDMIVVDATRPMDEVQADIREIAKKFM